jgi:RNA polymerase sigma factor (sigma-70 family)
MSEPKPSQSTTKKVESRLNRIQNGDKGAVDELIEIACDRLRRLTRFIFLDFKRVRRFADSADVTQDVLIRLTRRLRVLIGKKSPWPGSMADFMRLASREIRQAFLDLISRYFGKRGAGHHEKLVGAIPFVVRADPQELQHWTEFHEQAGALPKDQKDVFYLRWYLGLSALETAEVLGISLAGVKRRWLAARLRLNEFLP